MGNTPSDPRSPSVLDVHLTSLPNMTGLADEDSSDLGPPSSDDDEGVGKWTGSVPPPGDEDDLVGTTLSNTYSVIRILGEGGMGRVYEAQHTRIQSKKFAVKALHPEFARRADVLARFQREVEAAASINSPHVVGVYDVDQTADGRPFLVSELLQGIELGDHLDKEGQVALPWAVSVVRQICQALIEAHAQGVVHRDMKPENVFLTGPVDSPLAKVLDFGISRLDGQQGNTLTKTGFIMGTPSYMAPEQAKGMRVDHRADIYSVGAILYQMVTGTIPFDRADATATLAAVLTEEPEAPRNLAPEIPEHFEMIIQRAMAREPEDRYQTMADLDGALAAYDPSEMSDEPSRSLRLRPTRGSMVDATAQAREATEARPQLALFGGLALFGALLGLVSAVAAIIRLGKDEPAPTVTTTEALVIGLVLVAALSTPVALLLRHVKKAIWPNTAKVLELLRRLRPPVVVGLSAYGLSAVVLRAIETVLLRNAAGPAWAGWDLLLPTFAMGCAAAVFVGRGNDKGAQGPLERLGLPMGVGLASVCGLVLFLGAMGLRGGGDDASAGTTTSVETGAETDAETSGLPTEGSDGAEAPKPASTTPPLTSKASIAQWNKVLDHMKKGSSKAAIDALVPLLELDPNAPTDKNVREGMVTLTVRGCLKQDETCTKILDILTEGSGHHGPDILYEILITKGGTSAHRHAERLLQIPEVQKRASKAMLIAYRLRTGKGCNDRAALFSTAVDDGDHRALRELKILDSRRNCRLLHCCELIDDKDLEASISALEERL